MDWQIGFNALFGLVTAVTGWVLHAIYEAINELRKSDGDIHERISQHIESLPGIYNRRDDFSAFAVRVESALVRIEAKLDSKTDK